VVRGGVGGANAEGQSSDCQDQVTNSKHRGPPRVFRGCADCKPEAAKPWRAQSARRQKESGGSAGPPLSREAGFLSLPLRELGSLGRSATAHAAFPAITRVVRYALPWTPSLPGPNSQDARIVTFLGHLVKTHFFAARVHISTVIHVRENVRSHAVSRGLRPKRPVCRDSAPSLPRSPRFLRLASTLARFARIACE